MLKKDVRVLSNRPLLFAFIGLMSGILIGYSFLFDSVMMTVLIILGAILLICLGVFKKFSVFIAVICSVVIGVVGFVICYKHYESNILPTTSYKVEGRVTDTFTRESDYSIVTLDDCKIMLEGVVKSTARVTVFVSGESEYTYGDILTFYADIETEKFSSFGTPSYNVVNGIYYTAEVEADDLNIGDNYLKLDEKIRMSFKESISGFFNPTEAGLAYAIIFGDKQLLEDGVTQSFKYSGIAHLLAVSGTHFTLLFGALAGLLARLGVRRDINFVVLLVLVFAFMWLCGFAPCVTRAGFMFIVMYIAYMTHRLDDGLNSLSIAGILILLLNPLDLFDVGFLLSVTCMLGMMLFNNFFIEKLSFLENEFLQGAIATAVSTTITTYPIMCLYFDYFSVLGVLTNIILLPIFEVAFVMLVVIVLIGFVIQLKFLFMIVAEMLGAIISVSKGIANLDYSIVYVFPFTMLMAVIACMIIFIISRRVMLRSGTKSFMIFGLCVIVAIASVASVNKTTGTISFVNSTNSIVINSSEKTLIGFPNRNINIQAVNDFSSNGLITHYDNIVLDNTSFLATEKLVDFVVKFKVKNIYILESEYDHLKYLTYNEEIGNKILKFSFDLNYDLGYNVVAKSYNVDSHYYEITMNGVKYNFVNSEEFKADDLALIKDMLGDSCVLDGEGGYTRFSKDKEFSSIRV